MSVVDPGYLAGAAFRADGKEIVRALDVARAKIVWAIESFYDITNAHPPANLDDTAPR